MNSFTQLQWLLGGWPEFPLPDAPFVHPVHERLRRALRGLSEDSTGPADLAGLVAHALHREALLDPTAELAVPRDPLWPSRELWADHGVSASPQGVAQFRLRPNPWRPSWIEHDGQSPIAPALREDVRRHDAGVPADPAVAERMRTPRYVSAGQRAAVRAAFLLPPGQTLLVNLPTGGGKSLVFQSVARAAAEASGLTVVIVPTVALACDQARRFGELMDEPTAQLAYHSGLSEEERAAMRRAIRAGSQCVVFASPETALGALRLALLDVAAQGRLRHLVIDEVHLVAQWGTEFRPAFQMLAGMRDVLRNRCPLGRELRTLLLTATLTEETAWVLGTLFGAIEVVSSIHLRPEPEHWLARAPDEDARVAWVIEAVRRVPRPFVLYTSRRDDADAWHARLRGMGMRRVGCIKGGDARTDEGAETLRRWAERELDAVVATAAFGLGVDQSDVRAVIHACVPETVDRYYQEVGRAGRDGRAAFALMVHTPDDLHLARRLSSERVIGVDKGLGRWAAMFAQGKSVGTDRYEVPLDAQPAWVNQPGRENVAWNRRTLLLMARMGMIRVIPDGPVRLQRLDGESEETYDARCEAELERCFRYCVVEVYDGGHLARDNWERRRREERSRSDDPSIEEVVDGETPLADVFTSAYHVPAWGVMPEPAEPGCPVSRREQRWFTEYAEPEAPELRSVVTTPDPTGLLTGLQCVSFRGGPLSEASSLGRHIATLLERVVARGGREIAVPRELAAWRRVRNLWRHAPEGFVVHRLLGESEPPRGGSPLRRVTVLNSELPHAWWKLFELERPGHVLVVPDTLPDPARPERRLLDLRPQTQTIEEFLERLDQ
jgi:ATP-dependent DNA helicase RecQ